jgi:acetyl esterase/lipase
MVTRCWLYSFLSLFSFMVATAQQELPLYGTGPIPNSKAAADEEKDEPSGNPVRHSLSKVSRPTIAVYLPAAGTGNGTAVIICPGGGYDHLAITHEGTDVAQALSGMGIAAFVLKYRLPSDETMVDKTIGPLQDAQRAIQLVRQRAADWGVNPDRVGIMGFSAGGHLASTAGTHFNKAYIDNKDNISLRPDFMVLLYPVISFNYGYAHHGSRNNLIGPHPDTALIREYSNELQVTAATPPTFIVHCEDDKVVPVVNTLYFYEALQRNGVQAEMHIYPKGGHGFGMHNTTTKDEWMDRLRNWLGGNGWLKR